jgi:RNA methyltransferase, TrmH family
MSVLRSRDNPRLKRWTRLARDAAFRRKENAALLEGPRLVQEALAAGLQPLAVVASESGLERPEIRKLATVVVSDSLFRLIADTDSPPGIAAEIAIPAPRRAGGSSIFLEGVQDPGNVGAIVRSAAAFGIDEVVLDRGSADAWSPRALRAGMGGHFRLSLRSVADLAGEVAGFSGRVVCASPRGGQALRAADLSGRLGWLFGGEGQGVSERLAREADLTVSIPMRAGVESLNVAASAAVCLYEVFSTPGAGS